MISLTRYGNLSKIYHRINLYRDKYEVYHCNSGKYTGTNNSDLVSLYERLMDMQYDLDYAEMKHLPFDNFIYVLDIDGIRYKLDPESQFMIMIKLLIHVMNNTIVKKRLFLMSTRTTSTGTTASTTNLSNCKVTVANG